MNTTPLTLEEMDRLYDVYAQNGQFADAPAFNGKLSRHYQGGDLRLGAFRYDPSPVSFYLWNFLMTEEERLHADRAHGKKIVGVMKDLGTIPVLAYAFPEITAFYPDGAWWLPCFKALQSPLLDIADSLGMGDGMCPVRAMLGAFENQCHFPIPDYCVSSAGAICDDFAAVVQRLAERGHVVRFWEIPHGRTADPEEEAEILPDGRRVPALHVRIVQTAFAGVRRDLETLTGHPLSEAELRDAIAKANAIRADFRALRRCVYSAPYPVFPALEMLICEMLAIHYCSDRDACAFIVKKMREEAERRRAAQPEFPGADAPARIYWINPIADLKVMNLLEEANGMLCGSDFMFPHAYLPIDTAAEPLHALAQIALCDPMAGTVENRIAHMITEIRASGAEGVVLSRIPGASHCAWETERIRRALSALELPCADLEIASFTDAYEPALRTRLEALTETAISRR